ncbi:MAG: hypothetical protein ACT4P8_12770 [Betaproteobacteria bacterium]
MHKGRDGRQINTTGVCIERNDRYCVVYRGTRAALIEAGLAGPGHFPDAHRRLTWHFPKAGTNWSIRRKTGGVYALTKLKDSRGIVAAELDAFRTARVAEARRDSGFQRFLDALAPASGAPHARTQEAATERHARRGAMRGTEQLNGLETVAVATLLLGFTIYFWTRQA